MVVQFIVILIAQNRMENINKTYILCGGPRDGERFVGYINTEQYDFVVASPNCTVIGKYVKPYPNVHILCCELEESCTS